MPDEATHSSRVSQPRSESDPIAETIETIVELNQLAERNVSLHQRAVEHGTAMIGRPRTLYVLLGAIVVWIVLNSVAAATHHDALDAPPFVYLQGFCGLGSLFITLVVLITQ